MSGALVRGFQEPTERRPQADELEIALRHDVGDGRARLDSAASRLDLPTVTSDGT